MKYADFWSILEIEPTKDKTLIKEAYAKLTKVYHPEDQPEQFQNVQKAYRCAIAYANAQPEVLSPNIEPMEQVLLNVNEIILEENFEEKEVCVIPNIHIMIGGQTLKDTIKKKSLHLRDDEIKNQKVFENEVHLLKMSKDILHQKPTSYTLSKLMYDKNILHHLNNESFKEQFQKIIITEIKSMDKHTIKYLINISEDLQLYMILETINGQQKVKRRKKQFIILICIFIFLGLLLIGERNEQEENDCYFIEGYQYCNE